MVTVTSVHDSKVMLLLMRTLKYFLCSIKIILADSGYRGEIIEQVKSSFGYVFQVIMRYNDKKLTFKPTHKRWVIERTFAWFDNDRRLTMNY